MQGIGERLEEARNRKGISLREAAEATKIRSDFLSQFEKNKFDFPLPEIYRRGFLKNYAKFLEMDAGKLLTDYDAQQLTHSRTSRHRGAGEWFGHMDIKKSATEEEAPAEQKEGEAEAQPSLGSFTRKAKPAGEPAASDDEEAEPESDKMLYLKVGLVFVGTLALVFVLFGLIRAILGGGAETPEEPVLREAVVEETVAEESPDTITLTASGNVYVLVKQLDDEEIVYRDTLSAGQSVPVTKSGPVEVLFTAGENLVIEHAGEFVRPSSAGTAKISLP